MSEDLRKIEIEAVDPECGVCCDLDMGNRQRCENSAVMDVNCRVGGVTTGAGWTRCSEHSVEAVTEALSWLAAAVPSTAEEQQ